MKAKIILAAMLAAATIGNAYADADPYFDSSSAQWTETKDYQTSYDQNTIYYAKMGWLAVWVNMKYPAKTSHGYLHTQEVDRITIVCKQHVYGVVSASLYDTGIFLTRHDYSRQEIVQSITKYDANSPIGAVAAEVCGGQPSQW